MSFENKFFEMNAKEGVDEMSLEKCANSDWSHISMYVNGDETRITLRSENMARQLHFMLGLMLEEK